jgi:hypothetical protein
VSPRFLQLCLEVDIYADLHGVKVEIYISSLATNGVDPIGLFAKVVVAVFSLKRPSVVNGIFGASA